MSDVEDQIIRYENGEMNEEEITSFFQGLIDGGVLPSLQGHFSRKAMVLITKGACHLKGCPDKVTCSCVAQVKLRLTPPEILFM
jgi:hypothetical protein